MQAGQLERRYWGPQAPSEPPDTGISKVRCPRHISLAQLKQAYAEFKVKKVPALVASAAQSPDDADASAPHQPAQPAYPDAPQHRQTSPPSHVQPIVHTSVSTGAVNGMAPPAYATQMDGPNDVFDALAATAADSLGELSRASAPCSAAGRVLDRGDKRDRFTLQDAVNGAPAKKAKSGELQLAGIPGTYACSVNHNQHARLLPCVTAKGFSL